MRDGFSLELQLYIHREISTMVAEDSSPQKYEEGVISVERVRNSFLRFAHQLIDRVLINPVPIGRAPIFSFMTFQRDLQEEMQSYESSMLDFPRQNPYFQFEEMRMESFSFSIPFDKCQRYQKRRNLNDELFIHHQILASDETSLLFFTEIFCFTPEDYVWPFSRKRYCHNQLKSDDDVCWIRRIWPEECQKGVPMGHKRKETAPIAPLRYAKMNIKVH